MATVNNLRTTTARLHTAKPIFTTHKGRMFVTLFFVLLTTATVWAQDAISGLTYNTAGGYYEIKDAQDLVDLANYVNGGNGEATSGKTFKQTTNISLSGNFTPIGSSGSYFKGTYDGGGYTITGLSISTTHANAGLFTWVEYGTVKNVLLIEPTITVTSVSGNISVGALVGYDQGGHYTNCYVFNPTFSCPDGAKIGAISGDLNADYSGRYTDCYFYSNNVNDGLRGNAYYENTTSWRFHKLTLANKLSATGDGVKLSYGGNSYVTTNASVTLSANPDAGYVLSTLTVKQGDTDVAVSGTGNTRTFTMPNGDVTVTATFELEQFSYIDTDGTKKWVVANQLTSETSVLRPGWYVVPENTTITRDDLTLYGPENGIVNLILSDGATLNIIDAGYGQIKNSTGSSPQTFVIWGQENGSGTLNFNLLTNIKSVTVNGGILQCSNTGYTYVINNINDGLIVNGGEVRLVSGNYGSINGNVTYNGGILDTKKINGNTTLSWSHATTDRVKVSEYGGSVTIANGKYFKNANGNFFYGTLTDAQKNAIKNVELQPAQNAHSVTVGSVTNGTATVDKAVVETNNIVTLTVYPNTGYTGGSAQYNGHDATKTDDTHFMFTMPGEDVTVTAVLAPIEYIITYNGVYGATFSTQKNSYTVESQAITLDTPTKTGYTFGGWYDTPALTGNAVTTIASGSMGNVQLWAKWTITNYSINYETNGGEFTTDNYSYNIESAAITLDTPTKTGYTFGGWYDNPALTGNAVTTIATGSTGVKNLYAKWIANTYTVHFDPVISVYGEMADQTFSYDQEARALTANVFSTTIGEWLSWNTEPDGTGTDYENEQKVQNLTDVNGATVTLYAQWRMQHRFNYNNSIFLCHLVNNPNQVNWAYQGESVKIDIINNNSVYTLTVTAADGTDITLDNNTFTMPDQEVWVSATSVKKIAPVTIQLDDFNPWDDVVYLYDANHPTVTPTVTVKDKGTRLTEGTDYTLAITNNTGNATQMVTATVTVTGMGDYVGTCTTKFRITPYNIANCEIRGKLEAYEDGWGYGFGSVLCNNVQVWNGETQLELDTDYSIEVEYSDSYEIGQTYQATVKGLGDWGGTKTFTFTMIELHHTVVFNANGGTGTMASFTMTNDEGQPGKYTLPQCGFTAPPYMSFDHWEVSCEPGENKQPDNYFTAPYLIDESDVQTIIVTACWKADDEIPYIADDGTTQSCSDFTMLYGGNMPTELSAGWYVATGEFNYKGTVTLNGNVHLILADGCQMNIGTSDTDRINGNGIGGSALLTIYGQSTNSDMGTLSVYTTGNGNNGIHAADITINGGHVMANTNGPVANALLAWQGDVTINGGIVEATTTGTDASPININGNFIYNGGIVNTDVNSGIAIYAYGKSYTFNWRNLGDRITIDDGGLFAIGGGSATFNKLFKDADGNSYGGTLTGTDALATLAGKTLSGTTELVLANDADNTALIAAANGVGDLDVTLSGRTLTKDGYWNTLCLPFNVTAAQMAETTHPLYGATIKELDNSADGTSLNNGELTLKFNTVTDIEAGKPYIVKWTTIDDNITDPVFTGVTIDNNSDAQANMIVTSDDQNVMFVGQYSPFSIGNENINEILYVASGNKIGYSSKTRTLKSCRAHFWVKPNGTKQAARMINVDFGEGETTEITNTNLTNFTNSDEWYTLDGRKLDSKPTTKGIYVNNGRKVVIK